MPAETTPLQRTISKSWKVIVGGIALLTTSLGIVTGYLSLVPKISVSQNYPLNPSDLFSTPFIVSNDGPMAINRVQVSCEIGPSETAGISNLSLTQPALQNLGTMEPGERGTYPCGLPQSLIAGMEVPDVVFVIKFRPNFVPWHLTRKFRFVRLRAMNGDMFWFPETLGDPLKNE